MVDPAGKRPKYNSYGAEDVSVVSAYSNGTPYNFTLSASPARIKPRARPLQWALLHLSIIKAEMEAGMGPKKIFRKYVTGRKNLGGVSLIGLLYPAYGFGRWSVGGWMGGASSRI